MTMFWSPYVCTLDETGFPLSSKRAPVKRMELRLPEYHWVVRYRGENEIAYIFISSRTGYFPRLSFKKHPEFYVTTGRVYTHTPFFARSCESIEFRKLNTLRYTRVGEQALFF